MSSARRPHLLLGWLLLLSVAVAALLSPQPAAARKSQSRPNQPKPPGDAEQERATQELAAVESALKAADLPGAYRHAVAAFQSVPSPEALLWLGRVALRDGRTLDAQDLMRRYLADPNLELGADAPEVLEAQRIASQPRANSAQLYILGDRETLVMLDGRVVGNLPLSRPLLLTVAEHKLELSRGERRVEDQIRVPVGRVGELRSDLSTKTLLLSILPSVVMLDQYSGLDHTEQLRLAQTLEEAVQKERLALLGRDVAFEITGEPPPGPCPNSRRCALDLAGKCEADYLLRVHSQRQGRSWQLEMELVDGTIGERAAQSESTCSDCSVEQAGKQLAAMFAPLYKEASKRPRSRLELSTEPSGAQVLLDEQPVGTTPYAEATWGGRRQLLVQSDGYQEERRTLELADGETAKLALHLTPLPEPSPLPLAVAPAPRLVWQRAPRPRWRLITGAAIIAVGALSLGFGISGLHFAGLCTDTLQPVTDPPTCPQVYNTGATGITLTTFGLLFIGAGTAMMAWPGQLREVTATRPAAAAGPVPLLSLNF